MWGITHLFYMRRRHSIFDPTSSCVWAWSPFSEWFEAASIALVRLGHSKTSGREPYSANREVRAVPPMGYPFGRCFSPKTHPSRGLFCPGDSITLLYVFRCGGGMRTSYTRWGAIPLVVEERRQRMRYQIDCPVTVLTPGRGRKRTIGRGWLHDVSDRGARFNLDHALVPGDCVSLELHFLNPDGEVTNIRYRAVVKRVLQKESYEIAVAFLNRGSFVRRGNRKDKDSQWVQMSNSSNWIN